MKILNFSLVRSFYYLDICILFLYLLINFVSYGSHLSIYSSYWSSYWYQAGLVMPIDPIDSVNTVKHNLFEQASNSEYPTNLERHISFKRATDSLPEVSQLIIA